MESGATATTDANGRAEVCQDSRRARVFERWPSWTASDWNPKRPSWSASGLRIMLVATDPEAVKREAEDKALAAAAAVKGMVVLGPESRVIAQMQDDRLNIYYILEIINSARTPVDVGGPHRV